MTQMKLSEIWDKADKELTQIKREFGFRAKKTSNQETCALGAIVYYTSKYQYLGNVAGFQWTKGLAKFENTYGSVTFLNDTKSWTFKQFADAARAIGE